MNVSTENVSYIIPLEELDLLHLRKYMDRPRDRPMKLWSKSKLNGDSEYCEVKIVSKKVMGNSDISWSVPTQTYLCHICDVQVPIAGRLAHSESAQHYLYKNICNTALRRIKNHMNTEEIMNTEKIHDAEYFCEVCSKIFLLKDKLKHESSTEHMNSLENFVLLNKFNNLFDKDTKGNEMNDDMESVKDNYVNDSDEDSNAVRETREIITGNNDDTIIKFNNDNECNGVATNEVDCQHHDDPDNDEKKVNKNNNDYNGDITDTENNQHNEDSESKDENKMYFSKYYEQEIAKCIEKNTLEPVENQINIDNQDVDQENKTDCDYTHDSDDNYKSSNELLNKIKKAHDKINDQNIEITRRAVSLKQKFLDFKNYLEKSSVTLSQENNIQNALSNINNNESCSDLKKKSKSKFEDQKFIAATTTSNLANIQQLDIKISPETLNFENYLKTIMNKYNLNAKIDTDGDYVILENIKSVKFKVLQQNFHSYKVICSKIYCQLCKYWIQDFATSLNTHEMSEQHVKLVLLPVNEYFFRELTANQNQDRQPGHCIVCNEAVLLDSQYHLQSATHQSSTAKSVIPKPIKSVKSPVLCLFCNIHVEFPNYYQHLNSRKHIKIARIKNHIFKRDVDVYTCNLCKVVLNGSDLIEHINDVSHLDKLEQMSSEKEFCKTYGFKVQNDLTGKPYQCKQFFSDTTNKNYVKVDSGSKDSLNLTDYKSYLKSIDENLMLCTVCNVELKKKKSKIVKHMSSKEHIDLEKMQLYMLFIRFCEPRHIVECEICPLEFRNKNEIIIKHMESEEHEMYETSLFEFHGIVKYYRSYNCSYCDKKVIDVIGHIYSKYHILTLQIEKQFNKEEMIKYLYERRAVNPRAMIYEKLYTNFVTHNCVTKADVHTFHCRLCNKYFKRVNEIHHILGNRHFNNINSYLKELKAHQRNQ
ncbi:uncharacterized protein LOC111361613 [Spodoptera litura]|uniref:Uncharacterized protein LOC111361613 n=1 Tax=Spodoptera litura TaxID=69820 RepID=A0A9J7J053_SPOLT|nr:uncharacterized protein LOC111361613 [Spodoptera litura]